MDTTYLPVIIVSILFSAFFSGMEIAFVSANRIELSIQKKQGSIVNRILLKLMTHPGKFIATMLIGNNVTLVVYGYYMGRMIIQWLFPSYLSAGELPIGILLIQTLISTLVILITGEFLPKAFFKSYAQQFLRFFAIPVYIIYQLLSWLGITDFMMWLSNVMITRVLKGEKSTAREVAFAREDLGDYIEEQIDSLNEDQKEEIDREISIFKNALDFHDVKARECMVPRTEIVAVDASVSLEELRKLFVETGFSKIPVYKANIDDVIGYVHSFEFFQPVKTLKEMLLPVEYVPETMPVNILLNRMIKDRRSVAIVLDEYGGTAGMITVEDMVEELVGDIEDEHDAEEADDTVEKRLSDHQFLFSARLEVDYLNEEYGLDLPESDEYETLGGLVLSHTENIPSIGQEVEVGDYRMTVKTVSDTKIGTVLIEKNSSDSKKED